ncbi:MAG: TetR/AcrR family transcriptional regulator [Syntrophorhabdales bacterium]|jgi:AcrR family transcriptional regulator
MGGFRTGEVKEAIVRESMKLFLANGFRGTSVKEITEAAGIGRGTLYWYFKSKDEILTNVFQEFDDKFVGGLMEAVGGCEGDFVAKYKTFHKFATEFARDNRVLALVANALLNEVVGTNTEAERLVKAVYERYRLFIYGMLEEGKRDGSVRADLNSSVYAHVVVASHAGMLVQWFVNGETFDVPAFVKVFRNFILEGATGRDGR